MRVGIEMLLALAATSAWFACGAFGEGDPPPAGSGGGAGDDAMLADSFEQERPACGFAIREGTASLDPEARTGSRSCRLCVAESGRPVRMERTTPDAGAGTYVLEAWYRQVPEAGSPTRWSARLFTRVDGGEVRQSSAGELDQIWRLGQVTLTVGDDATEVVARVGTEQSRLGAGDCMLIDDLAVRFQP
jgi:hypothetical protein